MTHLEKFDVMVKVASPRWAKMLTKLGPASQARLAKALPMGSTRVVGKELGRGVEGRVFPSFTGGQGHSATKVFNDRPSFRFERGLNGQMKPVPAPELGQITGGGGGVHSVFGGVPISDRVSLMRQNPHLFPQVFGTNPRGYTVERLAPIQHTGSPLTREAAKQWAGNIKHHRSMVNNLKMRMALNEPKRTFWDWLRQRPAAGTDRYNALKQQYARQLQEMEASKSMFRQYYNQRNTGLASPSHPIRKLEQRMSSSTGTSLPLTGPEAGRSALMMNGQPIGIRDFGYFPRAQNPIHNIMQSSSGRALISDPVPYRLRPSAGQPGAWETVSGHTLTLPASPMRTTLMPENMATAAM